MSQRCTKVVIDRALPIDTPRWSSKIARQRSTDEQHPAEKVERRRIRSVDNRSAGYTGAQFSLRHPANWRIAASATDRRQAAPLAITRDLAHNFCGVAMLRDQVTHLPSYWPQTFPDIRA
mgnify:CR=1 FL=1